jgi:hypothetical protein
MKLSEIAEVAYEAVRVYDKVLGSPSSPPWSELTVAEQNINEESVKFVTERTKNGDVGGAAILDHHHDISRLLRDGWKYGETFSSEEKTSPRLLPFEELSRNEQVRCFMWCGTVATLQNAR